LGICENEATIDYYHHGSALKLKNACRYS